MSIQQAQLMAGSNGSVSQVTTGQSSTTFGWSDGTVVAAFGSITGNKQFPLASGDNASSISSTSSVNDLQITPDPVYSGGKFGAFTSVTVYNQANSPVTFLASNATFVGGRWLWGSGASPVWTASGVTRQVTFN